jgi:hypothetical protein
MPNPLPGLWQRKKPTMSHTIRTLTSAGLLALLSACTSTSTSGPAQATLTDTLGLRFDMNCSGLCALTPQNAAITPKSCANGSGYDVFLLALDPLLSIYALRVTSSGELQLNAASPSHPVACTTEADCLAPGITMGGVTNSYTCQSGVCLLEETCLADSCTPWDGLLLTYDVLTLCQADLPWPTACPYITSQPYADRIAAVGDACGAHNTCATVPAACRQLTSAAPAAVDGGVPAAGVDAGS